MTKIAAIDDEVTMLRTLRRGLPVHGVSVVCFISVTSALEARNVLEAQDAILLDYHLLDGDGLSLVRALRRSSIDVPIVIFSGRASERERIAALDLDVADVVQKPCGMAELAARVRKATRRRTSASVTPRDRSLRFDRMRRELTDGKNVVELSEPSATLFMLFAQSRGRFIDRADASAALWDDARDESKAAEVNARLDEALTRLRTELGPWRHLVEVRDKCVRVQISVRLGGVAQSGAHPRTNLERRDAR